MVVRSSVALLLVAALTLACAGAVPAAPATPGPAAAVTITTSFSFDPDRITVAAGTTVTWTSIDDATDHTITSGAPMAPEGKFDGRVARVGTFSHTFKEVGTFAYYCKVHPTMVGTVTVR